MLALLIGGLVSLRRPRARTSARVRGGRPRDRGRVVRADPARPVALRVARRHRGRHRGGAGGRHRCRPRGRRPAPARVAQPRGRSCRRPGPGHPRRARTLPLRELEDPAVRGRRPRPFAIAASRGRRLTAVPIEPDPDGDPDLVPLGSGPAAHRRRWRPARPRRPRRSMAAARRAGRPRRCRRRPLRPPPATGAGHARRARAPSSASPTGSPTACGTTYGLRNLVAAPLRVDGRVEGAIVLSRRTNEPWTPSARRLLGRRRRRGLGRARPRLLAPRRRGRGPRPTR